MLRYEGSGLKGGSGPRGIEKHSLDGAAVSRALAAPLVDELEEVLGATADRVLMPPAPGDVKATYASIDRAGHHRHTCRAGGRRSGVGVVSRIGRL